MLQGLLEEIQEAPLSTILELGVFFVDFGKRVLLWKGRNYEAGVAVHELGDQPFKIAISSHNPLFVLVVLEVGNDLVFLVAAEIARI
jgi:hypothetical protein